MDEFKIGDEVMWYDDPKNLGVVVGVFSGLVWVEWGGNYNRTPHSSESKTISLSPASKNVEKLKKALGIPTIPENE